MKKILLTTATALAAFVVNASYLYWQVDIDGDAYNATVNEESYKFDGGYFVLKNTTNSSTYDLYDADGAVANGHAELGVQYYSIVDNNTSDFTYYVEMYNSSGNLIAKSATLSGSAGEPSGIYSEVQATTELSEIPTVSVNFWHPSSFAPVPEPTSAILMLFGAAMLGLKRKNRSIA